MKRVNFKFKSTALVLLALGLSSNLWGAIATGDYVLCTSTSDLVAGGHYIIASMSSGSGQCVSNVSNSNNRKIVAATVSNGKITVGSSSTIMTFTLGGSTGAWTFHTDNYAGTAGYLASASSGNNNHLRVVTTSTTATISFSSSAAVITLQPHTSRNIVRYNSSSSCFACYSSGQAAVYLYKLSASCTTAIDITKGTPTNGSFTLTGGGTDICIDEGNASVSLSNIAGSTHYHPTVVTVSGGGSPNIGTISAGAATVSNISADATINVTFVEDTKYTIQFTDGIHSQTVDSKQVYAGETFDFPTITDRTEKTSGTCEEVHYHFMGWVISTHAGEITAGDIKTGTSEAVSAAATYKAVWAAKDTSK